MKSVATAKRKIVSFGKIYENRENQSVLDTFLDKAFKNRYTNRVCRVVRIYSKSARQKDADGDSNLSIKQDSEPQKMRGGYCGQKMNITPELPTEMIDCLLMTEC